jgi:hypothetical protein
MCFSHFYVLSYKSLLNTTHNIPLSDHFMTFVGRKINYKTKFFPFSVQTIKYHSWNELNNEKLAKDFESAKFPTLYSNDCYDSNNF